MDTFLPKPTNQATGRFETNAAQSVSRATAGSYGGGAGGALRISHANSAVYASESYADAAIATLYGRDAGRSFQDVCITHILEVVKKPPPSPDRRYAFRALGHLALAAGSRILNNTAVLESTLEAIQQGLVTPPFSHEVRLVQQTKPNQKTSKQANVTLFLPFRIYKT